MKKNIKIIINKKKKFDHIYFFKNEIYEDFFKEFEYINDKIIIYDIKFIYNMLINSILKYKIIIIIFLFIFILYLKYT